MVDTRVLQGDALNLTMVKDASVDLVITSPPYFALRLYKDSGEVLPAVGNEDSPEGYLKSLDRFMEEMWRVLKPTGSVFVVLGDKFAGSGGHNNNNITDDKERGPSRYNQVADGIRAKSLMGLPWRFAIRQIDAGWILRQEIIWSKPNGMPESVRDRCRRAHEQVFHFTKQGDYYAAVDRIRVNYDPKTAKKYETGQRENARAKAGEHNTGPLRNFDDWASGEIKPNPLGALPPSVWEISTSGLRIPAEVIEQFQADKHYAAYPPELVRRIVEGWSPERTCDVCGEGHYPASGRPCKNCDLLIPTQAKSCSSCGYVNNWKEERFLVGNEAEGYDAGASLANNFSKPGNLAPRRKPVPMQTLPMGEKCACDDTTSPSRPAVVLDPFGGVGTTALVASILGRNAISIDLSAGYTRLALWRIFMSDHPAKLRKKWGINAQTT